VDIELQAKVHDRVGNIHDFVILFRAMSTSFWFSSLLYQEAIKKQTLLSTPADDYNVTVEYESLHSEQNLTEFWNRVFPS